jgi:hypothetical protein
MGKMSAHMWSTFQNCILAIFLASFGLLAAEKAVAELLPTQGTFSGFYHVNRAGVGRFKFFIIHQRLLEQMAPYEGKCIELEVLEARQPVSGLVIVEKTGRIKELSPPLFKLELKTVTHGAGGKDTFDIIYAVRNTSGSDLVFNANNVLVGVWAYKLPDNSTHGDKLDTSTGYTYKQLSFRETLVQRWNFISPMVPGERNHFYTGSVLLRPDEAAPFVLHSQRLDPGQYELAAAITWQAPEDKHIRVIASKPLDVPLPETNREPYSALHVEAQIVCEQEWLVVDARLINPSDKPIHIFVRPFADYFFLPALVQVYDREGELVRAVLDDWRYYDKPWTCRQVDKKGLPFHFRVRLWDRFSTEQISRMTLWTVTNNGLEKITVAHNLPTLPLFRLPPWGKTVHGAHLRIRTAKDRFRQDEQVRLFCQTQCDGKEVDLFWIDKGNFQSHVLVEIDGENVSAGPTGISEGLVYFFPFQREITLPWILKIAPGKHHTKLTIKGDGGTFTNLRNEKFRKFSGTLISNEVEFEVVP